MSDAPAPVVGPPEGRHAPTPAQDRPAAPPPQEKRASRLLLAAKVAAVAIVIGLVVTAWRLGAFEHVKEPARLKEDLLALGAGGYAAFVLVFALLQPFGLPGIALVGAAPLVWPWYVAFALSMCGATLATIVGFSFARFVAREAVAKRIPKRFHKYDQRLADKAFTTILLLRLVFWVHPLLHVFFGTSKVKFTTHVAASFLAYLAPFFVVSYFGQRVLDLVKEVEGWHWIIVAVVVLKLGVVGWSVWRWMQRRKGPESRPPETLATSPE